MIKDTHHIAEGHDPEDGLTHGLDTVEGKSTHDVLQQGQYVKGVWGLTRTCGRKTAVYEGTWNQIAFKYKPPSIKA